MSGVKRLPGLSLDQIRHPPRRPQPRAVAQRFRALLQAVAQLHHLRRLQSWFAPGPPNFLQRPSSVGLPRLMPTTDRLAMHAQSASDLGLTQLVIEEFSSSQSSPLQLIEVACDTFGIAHAVRLSHPSAKCHYIMRESVRGALNALKISWDESPINDD